MQLKQSVPQNARDESLRLRYKICLMHLHHASAMQRVTAVRHCAARHRAARPQPTTTRTCGPYRRDVARTLISFSFTFLPLYLV